MADAPLSTPAAQGTVTPEELAKQIADAAADMCEIARIADEWRRGPKQSLTAIREIRATLSVSPSPEALPASGVDALMKAIRRAEDGAGTLPAKEAVKLRPADWHAVCRLARALTAAPAPEDR